MRDFPLLTIGLLQLCVGLLGLAVAIQTRAVEESELLRRIAKRDQRALRELYQRYSRILYTVGLTVLRHERDAEELLQEVFVIIWTRAETFNAQAGTAYSWLLTLTRNRAIDRLRTKEHRLDQRRANSDNNPLLEQQLADESTRSPMDAALAEERAARVREAMHSLPSDQKEPILLAYFSGFSQSEIAEQLKLPLGTVKSRMRLGLLALADRLKAIGV